ncbi:MAG: energy transducer TonB [Acidobacteria bacterium]|nr:energy transducer TonB [Acidobacteriota bacterium]
MAKKEQTRLESDASTELAAGDFLTFAQEYEEDRKTMRWAGIVAVVLHVIFFAVQLPKLVAEEKAPKKTKVYVVQQVRFKPPPPKQQQEIPKPKSKKVPIPDPTPDEPEPLRLQEDIEPDVDMPDTDIIMGIPDGPPPMEPSGPIRVGGDVKAPKKLFFPSPQYTEIARKARITGVVIIEAIIDKQGDVTNVKILKGLPMGLDQAAADAVARWKFEPATLNGKPVAVIYNLTVNFQLQ